MNKKDNIFWFFLIALALHLSLFIVKERGIKGEAPLVLKNSSAPLSVKVKSISIKKQEIKTSVTPAKPIIEDKTVEKKSVEPIKKESVKPEVKSKIKDKKKDNKKLSTEKIKKETIDKINKEPKDNIVTNEKSLSIDEEILANGNFNIGKDGIFTAASSDGIDYRILKQIEPNYPIQAERIRYKKKVIVSVRFLVGLNGKIEKIDFLQSHSKLGFDDEVKKALNQWVFHPIYYKNKNIKVYFMKDFIFEPKF